MINARVAARAGLSLLLTVNMCPVATPCIAFAEEAMATQTETEAPSKTSVCESVTHRVEFSSSLDASDGSCATLKAETGVSDTGLQEPAGADDGTFETASSESSSPSEDEILLPVESETMPGASDEADTWGVALAEEKSLSDVSASLSTSEAIVGADVSVAPSAEGGLGAFVFNYVWERDGWADWDSTVRETSSFTADASFVFTPSSPGTYTVYVDVMQVATGEVKTVEAGTVVVKARAMHAGATLSDGPYSVGSPITVIPAVSGAAGTVEYNYVWERDGWAAWGSTMNETGAFTADESFQFEPDSPGTYTFYIDIVDTVAGTTTTVSAGTAVVSIRSWEPEVSLSAHACNVGSVVTVTSAATGAAGSFEFNYVWERDGWAEWDSTVRSTGGFTSDASFAFAPVKAGTYHIYVDVKDKASGETKTADAGSLTVSSREWSASMNLDPGATGVGATLTIAPIIDGASAAGFTYNYVWQRDGWADWGSTVKDAGSFTSEQSWSFVPSSVGKYTFYIDVKSPEGVIRTVSRSLVVGEVEAVTASASVDSSSIDLGDSLTVTSRVQGAPASSLTYNYVWERDGWTEWGSTVKATGAFTDNPSFLFTPPNAGTYHLYVDVAVSGVAVTTVDVGEIKVKGAWKAKAFTVVTGSSTGTGGTVQVEVQLEGDTDGLEYNYIWERDGWADWNSLEINGVGPVSDSAYLWKLPDNAPGRYTFYVDVHDPKTGRTVTLQAPTQVTVAHDWASALQGKTFEWLEAAHYTPGREGNDWDTVVIHISESTTQSAVDNTFTGGEDKASTHFSVFSNIVHQYVHDFDTGWSVGNWEANTKTVSIEFVGTTENPPSRATMDTGAQLIAALCASKGWTSIGLGNHIGVHSDYSATSCPSTTDVPYIVERAQDYLRQMLNR